MKLVNRVREIEAMIGCFEQDYNIGYTYDVAGKVTKETITVGTFVITNDFTYDIEDNVVTDVKTFGNKVVTKTYTYTDGVVTNVSVVNSTLP